MSCTLRAFPLLVLMTGAGCSGDDDGIPSLDACGGDSVSSAVTTGAYDPMPVLGSTCDAVITQEPIGEPLHVEGCSRITYPTNPPSSGHHYGSWADFGVFDEPVARGYWVHSLEHGAVVLLHNCDGECDEEIEAARSVLDELPEETLCALTAAPSRHRALMTEDPLLDVPWAAAAWGYTLRSSCFEPEVYRAFATERLGQGPEALCAPGTIKP